MTIHQWLADRRRKYADGLVLFEKYASAELKKKLGAYFNEVSSCPPFDGHFTTLVNKLTAISRDMPANVSEAAVKASSKGTLVSKVKTVDNIKTVSITDIPEVMQQKAKRIKEITPLYAAVFGDMGNESLSDDERADLARQVFGLWCERKALWEEINAYTEAKGLRLDFELPKPEALPNNALLQGMLLAKNIERLKEKIKRTEEAIRKHSENGKENLKVQAMQRLENFKTELADLLAKTAQA